MRHGDGSPGNDQAVGLAAERRDCSLDVGGIADAGGDHMHAKRWRDAFGRVQEADVRSDVGIQQHRRPSHLGSDVLEHPEPLASDGRLEVLEARDVAARPREAADEAAVGRLGDLDEDERYGCGQPLQFSQGRIAADDDCVRGRADQPCRIGLGAGDVSAGPGEWVDCLLGFAPALLCLASVIRQCTHGSRRPISAAPRR